MAQLHILLALASGDKHGYAIMTEVEVLTEGAVTMGPGTLYGTVKKMLKAGLVEETDERPDPRIGRSTSPVLPHHGTRNARTRTPKSAAWSN